MRKAKPKKRVILPDPVFNDVKVSKFVNHLMYDGKKNTSYEIFYAALETVKAKMPNEEKSALEIWKAALESADRKCPQWSVCRFPSLLCTADFPGRQPTALHP